MTRQKKYIGAFLIKDKASSPPHFILYYHSVKKDGLEITNFFYLEGHQKEIYREGKWRLDKVTTRVHSFGK